MVQPNQQPRLEDRKAKKLIEHIDRKQSAKKGPPGEDAAADKPKKPSDQSK